MRRGALVIGAAAVVLAAAALVPRSAVRLPEPERTAPVAREPVRVTDPQGLAVAANVVARCEHAIHEKWAHLEAVEPGPVADQGTDLTVRFTVRLHDSFDASTIGVVECTDTPEGRPIGPWLTKVAR